MTTSSLALPTHNYSILSPSQYRVLRQRAQPLTNPNNDAEIERARQKHQATSSLVAAWPNTINRNRIDRQTRLKREKEAEEERKREIDFEEKRIQK